MADSKISELTALTTPASDDVLAIVDTSAGVTKKITISNLSTSAEVVDDTTPQLGGDLDLNSNDITGTGNIDVTGTVTADGLTVDNFTLDGTTLALSSGDFTVDVAGDILLDAGGNDLRILQGGTDYCKITKDGNNTAIKSQISDGDLILRGSDGGSQIDALTFDMSDAGKATFNNNIVVSDRVIGSADLILTSSDANEKIQLDDSGFINFASGGSEIMRLTTTGLGIGTTSPNRPLSVYGNAELDGVATASPQLAFRQNGTDKAYLTYWDSSDTLALTDGSANGLHFSPSTGKVGIGTTSPSGKLHVESNAGGVKLLTRGASSSTTTSNDADELFVDNAGNSGITIGSGTSNLGSIHFGDSGDNDIGKISYNHNGNSLAFTTNTSEAMRIDSSGKVGIGTTSPNSMFEVRDNASPTIRVTDGDANNITHMQADGANGGYFGTLTSHDVRIAPNNSTKLIVKVDGKVGIGTTSCDGKVHIMQGSAGSVTASTDKNTLVVEDSSHGGISTLTPDGVESGIFFGHASSNRLGEIYTHYDNNLMTFGTRRSGAEIKIISGNASEAMRIDSSGNLGIANTIPSSFNSQARNLVVGSGSGAQGLTIYSANDSSGNIFFADSTSGDDPTRGGITYKHDDNSMLFRVNDTNRLTIADGGATTITTADNSDTLTLISTDADAASGPNLRLRRNSSSPADDDDLGHIFFSGEDAAGNETNYITFDVITKTVADGSENGLLQIKTMSAGTLLELAAFQADGIVFNERSNDLNFRVESNNNANAIFVNGGTDSVTIGAAGVTHFLGGIAVASENNSLFFTDSDVMDTSDTAAFDTVFGWTAGNALTTGDSNTFMGYAAGGAVTTGSFNIMIGADAGDAFDTETNNLGIGNGALGGSIAGGEYNVAIGNYSLDALTSGDDNIAIGYNAGTAITSGYNNTLIGKNAGQAITTGARNTFIGYQAGDGHDGETYNLGIGENALGGPIAGGEFNVAIGSESLDALTSADSNTAIGYQSGSAVTTGGVNTFVGQRAGAGVTEGFSNTLIGANAAHGNSVTLTTGDQNTLVGRNIQTTDADSNTANGLGYFLSCEGGYTTVGQSGDDIRAAHGTATWATVSDERFKKNIETSDAGLAVINDLRPVTYNWKTMGEIPEWSRWYKEGSDEQYRNSKLNHGFVAQEVKAVIDSHSELKNGFSMWYEREDGQQEVGETAIVPILVKAVQELSATVTTLQQEINTLKGE